MWLGVLIVVLLVIVVMLNMIGNSGLNHPLENPAYVKVKWYSLKASFPKLGLRPGVWNNFTFYSTIALCVGLLSHEKGVKIILKASY